MKKRWLVAVFLMLGLSSNAYSQPVNYGFETGNTTSWVESYPEFAGQINVVTSWTGDGTTYTPVEGNYFAVLETGGPDGDYVTLSQRISLIGGQKLEGWAGFCCGSEMGFPYAGDNGNYNDYALISILNGYGNIIAVPWYADSADISYGITTPDNQWTGEYVNFGPVQWEHWSWTAPEQGGYTLQYQTTQGGDSEANSHAFFDGPGMKSTAVPEPSAMVLLGLCMAGIFAAHRLFRFDRGSRLA